MKLYKIIISILCLASIIPFTACSNETPFEVVEDDLANANDDAKYAYKTSRCYNGANEYDTWCCDHYGEKCQVRYSSSSMSESEKCYYNTGELSDSYCCSYYGYRCSYVSSSSSRYTSSSSSAVYYLTTAKSMKITLTYYKQVSSNWDGLDNAGDPEVSFTIYTYSDGVLGQTINTATFIDKQDTRQWSGSVTKSYTINKGTDQIKICPKVIDEDVSLNDSYTSGNCFTTSNIGYLKSTDIKEHEDYNSNYDLEWEWYLL